MYKLPHVNDTKEPIRFPITIAHQIPTIPVSNINTNARAKAIVKTIVLKSVAIRE